MSRAERQFLIKQMRIRQPLNELERKAKRARRKGLWTQEEEDWAKMAGERLLAGLRTLACELPTPPKPATPQRTPSEPTEGQ